jgi:putative transposase
MVKPAALRRAAGFLVAEFKMSARRACRTVGLGWSSWSYRSTRIEPVELVAKLCTLAEQRPRAGYRMLWLILRRTMVINHKRVYRLYRELGLTVRRRRRKRTTATVRTLLAPATRPNQRWSMDFVHDATWLGRRFRVLTLIDEFTREALALAVDTSIGGARVVRVLEELAARRGLPEVIVSDNGPEFTGKALDIWASHRRVKLHFIRPGKPVENGYCESFNGKLREECLNIHWFTDLADARAKIEAWRTDYNEVRPHSSLDGRSPTEYASKFNRGLTLKVA